MADDFAGVMKLKDKVRLPASVRNGVPSSLAGMATDNPFMLTLADIPVAPGIKAHSIIAIQGDDQPPKGATASWNIPAPMWIMRSRSSSCATGIRARATL